MSTKHKESSSRSSGRDTKKGESGSEKHHHSSRFDDSGYKSKKEESDHTHKSKKEESDRSHKTKDKPDLSNSKVLHPGPCFICDECRAMVIIPKDKWLVRKLESLESSASIDIYYFYCPSCEYRYDINKDDQDDFIKDNPVVHPDSNILHAGPCYLCEDCHALVEIPEDAVCKTRETDEADGVEIEVEYFVCPNCKKDSVIDEYDLDSGSGSGSDEEPETQDSRGRKHEVTGS